MRTRALIRETAWELFADDDYFGADSLEQRLTGRPAGEPALATLRARLIDENDRLRGQARASHASAERALAAAIAGLPAPD